MSRVSTALRFALADLWADRLAALLTILLLMVVMTPATLLYVAKVGLVSAWTEEIARDVSNREVLVLGGTGTRGWLSEAELARLRAWPEVGFVTPEPVFSVRAHDWAPAPAGEALPGPGQFVTLGLRTTLPGDPVFAGHAVAQGMTEVGCSAAAAAKLGVGVGDRVVVQVTRQSDGRLEREFLPLTLVAVVPASRWPRANVFVSPALARAIRAFQYHEVTRADFPRLPEQATLTWPSIRVYAPTIHLAPALRERLQAAGFDEVRLHSDQIARLQGLERGIDAAFGMLLVLGALGFCVSLFLLEWLSAERKTGDLALLVVLGFGSRELALLRLSQSLLLVASGCALALLTALAAQAPLQALGHSLLGLEHLHPFPLGDLMLGALAALLIGVVGSTYATLRLRSAELTAAIRKD
ncbi:FtsX-like permease family protein [Marichromatium bheemlicum]|uniref:ABC3 transporter permease C-terminal domain-containing protein n=1 Tax=Marichromatium bheemlicum TaxID=365339 RepID=A0ABX1I3Y8_9GAMM|nr:FtsX-like permease family protein [Marichromatium bheemlicum]NKN31679.1 hypothetical protein [Marichromatium bheemlicum]